VISGDAATRIYNEVVVKGIERSTTDTVEEAKRRAEVVEWFRDMNARGQGAEPILELP
jgi:hypothetical protein